MFLLLSSHLQFSQLHQVLSEGDRRQQRCTSQQQHVALLPLATAADGVLVAHCGPQTPRTLTGATTDWHGVGSQAAPQRPRVLGSPVTAGLWGQQGTGWLFEVTALLCGRQDRGEVTVLQREMKEEEEGRLTHFIKAGEAGGHGCVFGGLAKIWCTGWPNFAPLTERFQSVHTHKIKQVINVCLR